MTQPDLLHNSPPELVRVHLIAAETERVNPFYSPAEREAREAYHRQKAEKIARGEVWPWPA